MSGQLVHIIDEGSGPSLRPALRVIALSPRYTFGIHSLMSLPLHRLTDGPKGFSPAQAAAFLDQLYATRAASNRDDAFEWKAGMPALLLFEGKLNEANKAADDWLAVAPRERASYARAMQSVVRRALGQEGALDRIAAGCVPSRSWKENNPGAAGDYCIQAAVMLVANALDVLHERAAHGLVDAAYDLARIDGHDMTARLTLLGKAGEADPAGAQKHIYELLAEHDVPPGIQTDAVYHLVKIAAAHDPMPVAGLVDCWLQLRGVDVPVASVEMWKSLAAMPLRSSGPLAECSSTSANSWCVMHALGLRLKAAVDAREWDLAKQSIEKMAAITVANHGNGAEIRTELVDFAVAEIRGGRRADAVEILSYLKGQPGDQYVQSAIRQWADSVPAGQRQPWHSPVAVAHALSESGCPPHTPASPGPSRGDHP